MSPEPWSVQWKEQQLQTLYRKWYDCTPDPEKCQLSECRTRVVFGHGNPDADIIFVGEKPGGEEDEDGIPFVGRPGQLLHALCTSVDIDLDDLYLTNLVGCRTPENRTATRKEKDSCSKRLFEIIYIVDPLLIVAIGKEALQYLIRGRPWSIEREHGRLFSPGLKIDGRVFPRTDTDTKEVWHLPYDVVPLFDPAYILKVDSYNEEKDEFSRGGAAEQTLEDLRVIKRRLDGLREEYSRFPKQPLIRR